MWTNVHSGNKQWAWPVYNLRQRHKRAQWVADWVAEDSNNWYKLSHADKILWHEHNEGTIRDK